MANAAEERLLICRVAWMERYEGLEPFIYGMARHIRENGHGHEVYNFLRSKARVHGYVQFNGAMHIERLGADSDAESVSPVTVIWTAPRKGGGVYVVGWYRHATVYREMWRRPNNSRRIAPGSKSKLCWWSITAAPENVQCLDPDDRWFKIPARFVTQTLINYVDGGTAAEERLKRGLLDLVAGKLKPPKNKKHSKGTLDPDKLVKVERAAVQVVQRYFEDKGYSIESVERQCLGWDLNAARNGTTLHAEVKGCSRSELVAELTPNEYTQSRKKRDSYRICIVTDALKKPTLHVFRWSDEANCWRDLHQRRLLIETKTGAILRV